VDNGTKILIKDIWEMYFYTYYNKMYEIHYFKFFFEIITKFVVYYNLIIYFKVYSSNNNYLTIRMNNIYDNNIILIKNIDIYFRWLSLYPEFNKIILQFSKTVKNDFEKVTS